MAAPYRLRPATQLLARILKDGGRPADKHIEAYLREHRDLDAPARAFIVETVNGCLRRRRSLEALVEPLRGASRAELLTGAFLLSAQGWSARALAGAGFSGDGAELAARVRGTELATLPLGVRSDLPDWLLPELELDEPELLALGAALARPPTMDLRVNVLRGTRDEARARLAAEGFDAEPTPYSPWGLRRRDRTPLGKTAAFTEGLIEIQDEGSQLIALLVEPQRGERVVDFCAGAGGKTLALGALMQSSGTLYAFDVSEKRLAGLGPRLGRAGLSNVRPIVVAPKNDRHTHRLGGGIDRVLVDAPCSGSGALRRNPDMKWRDPRLDEVGATQRSLLDDAARLLGPGGRLVYATCSMLARENEAVVESFLASHPDFARVSAAAILAKSGIHIPDGFNPAGDLRLWPHRHATDGFYGAVLERSG